MLNVPKELTAGVSADWLSTLNDYPSSQWNLLINIAGQTIIPTTSTPQDDGGWLTEIDGADLEDAVPGEYFWSARVIAVEDGRARSVGAGNLKILANLATVDDPYDGRTPAKKIHDSILQALQDMAGGKIASYSIEGRSATYRTLEELNKAESYWRQRVRDEQAKIDVANGKANPRTIRGVFR
jgi:hypothetical protein